MATNETAAQPEAPAKPKMPVLLGVAVGALVVGGALGATVIGPMVAKKMGKTTPVVAAADSGAAHAAEGEHAPAEGGAEGEAAAAPAVHLLDNLVLNPAGSGGSRFLLMSVAIEASDAAAVESFKTRDAELRDIVLTALGPKTVDELTDISKREQFKKEIQDALTEKFGKNLVKRLYFPQFVVQ